MWTEDQVREYVRKRLRVYFYDTPSGIALASFYAGCTSWRFDKLRSFIESYIRIYKQTL